MKSLLNVFFFVLESAITKLAFYIVVTTFIEYDWWYGKRTGTSYISPSSKQQPTYLHFPSLVPQKTYLEKYRDVRLRLLEQQLVTPLSVEAQHRLSVHTTWEMSFEL